MAQNKKDDDKRANGGLRGIEGELASIGRLLEGRDFKDMGEAQAFLDEVLGEGGFIPDVGPRTPLEQAQELIYDAWEERIRGRRVKLAKEALEISPDCADAYVLMAEEAALTNPFKAVELYRKGVEAGERAIGPEEFEESMGHFWGILETRPYMRARIGLAIALWELGKQVEAIPHILDMLRLNPNDNQGIRYVLASWLLMQDADEELQELLDSYGDEPSACWLYTRALVLFRREGDTEKARKILKGALKQNSYVRPYLLGKKKLPILLPATIGIGDESEAVSYASDFMIGWNLTPGAIDWLKGFNRR